MSKGKDEADETLSELREIKQLLQKPPVKDTEKEMLKELKEIRKLLRVEEPEPEPEEKVVTFRYNLGGVRLEVKQVPKGYKAEHIEISTDKRREQPW